MTDDELLAAYDRFNRFKDDVDLETDVDPICKALGDYLQKHRADHAGLILPNRICAMLAIEAMLAWEQAEWQRD